MGLDHVDAVLDYARLGGSHRLILVVIARYADQHGEWRIDQPTLQRKSGLSRRRVQQILEELVAAGELAVVSHRGRGRLCTYRLQVGGNAQPAAQFPPKNAQRIAHFRPPLIPLFPQTPKSPYIPQKFRRPPVSGPCRGRRAPSSE